MDRFEAYCRRKVELAVRARPAGYRTIAAPRCLLDALALENVWTRALFDGPFYVSAAANPARPAVSLVFVQSRDGNTVTDDPASLGGGDTDLHVIYEGLSRVAADAVMAGASTAGADELVFSVWHPELVALRRDLGKPRHPAQVVVSSGRHLLLDTGLMFTTPALPVWLIVPTDAAARLRPRLRERPWITIVDAGRDVDLGAALRVLRSAGVAVVSAVGGRRTATQLIAGGLVDDLYLTTAPRDGGEPGTPYYDGPPVPMTRVLEKAGLGREAGVRFEHFRLQG